MALKRDKDVEHLRAWDLQLRQFSASGCNPAQRYALTNEIRRLRGELSRLEGYLVALWDATPPAAADGPMFESRIEKFGRVQLAYESESELIASLEELLWNQCRVRVA